MESVVKKAWEAFNGPAEQHPSLDSKAWWQQRAVSLEMEARAASDPGAAPLYTMDKHVEMRKLVQGPKTLSG